MPDYLNVVADISDYQPTVDFKTAGSEIHGVFIKATQGTDKHQKFFLNHRDDAKNAGLLVGSYHFAEEGSGRDQADHYLSVVGDHADELLVLDIERWKIHGSDQPPMTLSQAHEFVQRIHSKTGRWPGIYGGEYLKSILGNDSDSLLSNCWLWIAQYGPKPTWPKKIWKMWTFWQYTGDGVGPAPHDIPGIGANVDRDKFVGTLAELKSFWVGGTESKLNLASSTSALEESSAPPVLSAADVFSRALEDLVVKSQTSAGRTIPLLFPNGINYIQFTFTPPAGVSITIGGAAPAATQNAPEQSQALSFDGSDSAPVNQSVELRDEADPALFLAKPSDAACVLDLIECGSSAQGLKAARLLAKKFLPQYPHNGCAAHLSALLQLSGMDFEEAVGAGDVANRLAKRGWKPITVGKQRPGDVGVTFDYDPSIPGPDHVYLVVGTNGPDDMMIADNQRKEDAPHQRYASGYGGKTPTEYFLRAL